MIASAADALMFASAQVGGTFRNVEVAAEPGWKECTRGSGGSGALSWRVRSFLVAYQLEGGRREYQPLEQWHIGVIQHKGRLIPGRVPAMFTVVIQKVPGLLRLVSDISIDP